MFLRYKFDQMIFRNLDPVVISGICPLIATFFHCNIATIHFCQQNSTDDKSRTETQTFFSAFCLTKKVALIHFFFLLFRGLKYVIHIKLKKCHKNNFFFKLSSSPKFVFQEYIIEEIDKISGFPFHENLILLKN